jgi:hypothetical protein
MGEEERYVGILVGKPEGKTTLGRPRHRWTILRSIFRKWNRGIDWIDLAQNTDRWRALVNAVINLQVP